MSANGRIRRFGDFDFEGGKLFRDGQPVRLQPQPSRILEILVNRPGEIVAREELRTQIWGDATFVEFDQGLNYCIRQIRLALGDNAVNPAYIETLPKQGYRFIADILVAPNGANGNAADEKIPIVPQTRKPTSWPIAAIICCVFALAGGTVLYLWQRVPTAGVTYTQLTDFTDSATAPALSPDGHMVAFIRGKGSFLTADQVYIKVLPDGDSKRLTDDRRLKYSLAFSPDGSRIAYTVMESPSWATYTVSILGGDSHLLLENAAGLTWLSRDELLFSRTRLGLHMGIVRGTATGRDIRELYFPSHERAMAHYSYASPDRKSALVVEMDQKGGWGPCRLISLNGSFLTRSIGPEGACTSAAWSSDGAWTYFTAVVEGQSHLWRQRFSNGQPVQITSGPNEEEGVAVERGGRSVITSVGTRESAMWIHDADGDRSLSSEGEIITRPSPPSFSRDGKVLYYLLRHQSAGSGPELWRMPLDSGKSEPMFPGVSMLAYDVSPDNREVVYSTVAPDRKSSLWLAPLDRSSPGKRIGRSGESSPHFGPRGQIVFQVTEGKSNYLERMKRDGDARSKVVPYPIVELHSVSPGRRWVIAGVPLPNHIGVAPMAIPVEGGLPRRICESYCVPTWSSNGKFLFVPVEAPSRTSPGKSLAIPVGPGESLPQFPPNGINALTGLNVFPGSQWVNRAELVPGKDPSHFAYVNTTVHRNLYRVSLP